jgi:hypothetical protein
MNSNGQSTGLISKTLDWVLHPQFSDTDPVDWFAFTVLLMLAGYLWSKVIRQTLEATVTTVSKGAKTALEELPKAA